MITPHALTRDAQGAHRRLAADIAERIADSPELSAFVESEYQAARGAERTQLARSVFAEALVDQAACSWVLALILVRFLEDTGLVGEPILSGPGAADQRARDRLTLHYRAHPDHSERQYLESAFRELSALPGLAELFGPAHQLLYALGPSADGAKELIELFRRRDPHSGALVHDFTEQRADTRFLGDIYQDLSALAKKRYALLQTPHFVERFILDRTLEPAIGERGIENASLIDPACGSGHFLLGAFARLLSHWQAAEPHAEPRLLAQRCLDQIAGIDLNPTAAEIARFRLLVAALDAAGARTLKEAPDFSIPVAAADSLLHGPRPGQLFGAGEHAAARRHHYRAEDTAAATRLLSRSWACVVGNPPYITPKDPAENALYRETYGSCHRKYSLAVPFTERFFDLAEPAGYVGMITANAFMKREFGTKLVGQYLPQWDLTHVIDTSGAYIPGHGTPTVILFARNRAPRDVTVRCALGIRGEPSPPADPAKGLVWSAIEAQVDHPGSESAYISVVDLPRERLAHHPWSLGGGGAAELKEVIERAASASLNQRAESPIGRAVRISLEDAFIRPVRLSDRLAAPTRGYLIGERVRDWADDIGEIVLYPYDAEGRRLERVLWPWRAMLAARSTFQGNMAAAGLTWWEYQQHTASAYTTPLSITFAEVATHNHFVLDRGGKVFKQTAPVIKLPAGSTVDDHLALLGPLNSSTGCFWLQQVMQNKGRPGADSAAADERWEFRYQADSTKLARFPLPADPPTALARTLDALAQEAAENTPAALCARQVPTRQSLDAARTNWQHLRRQMVAHQEELDWRCYALYGVSEDELTYAAKPPEVAPGERAFEIVLARDLAAGRTETAWFTRHRIEPVSEIPAQWPADYRDLVERRIEAIGSSRQVGLIERPEYKRRWAYAPWEEQERVALRGWLLDRLEDPRLWDHEPAAIQSVGRLADRVRADADLVGVLSLYLGRTDYELAEEIGRLISDECVPYLAALRYSDQGMQKHAEWQEVWQLQRAEDAGQAVGPITPPPRYGRTDFRHNAIWALRGKLDVPKERFISYPGAVAGADPTAFVGWAGWDHRQRAVALATLIGRLQDHEGAGPEALTPLLSGLAELIPWLLQWHDEPDAQGIRFGQFAAGFLAERLARAGLSAEDLQRWRPPKS